MIPVRPEFPEILRRGIHRKCPQCGEGTVLKKRYSARDVCEVCGLEFVRNPGDLWAFWVVGDRLFLGALILFVFVLFRPSTWEEGVLLLCSAIVPMILTIPHRIGIAIALEYFSRLRLSPGQTASSAD